MGGVRKWSGTCMLRLSLLSQVKIWESGEFAWGFSCGAIGVILIHFSGHSPINSANTYLLTAPAMSQECKVLVSIWTREDLILSEAILEMQLWLLGFLALLRISVPKPGHRWEKSFLNWKQLFINNYYEADPLLGEPHRCTLFFTEIVFSACI